MKDDVMNGNGRMEALREKEKAIRARITAENHEQQKRKARDRAKLAEIIGSALVDQASSSVDLHLMLKQILGGAVTDASARRFLEQRGWV